MSELWHVSKLERHAVAGNELRIAPALHPLWDKVIAATLDYSGIRLRNARSGASSSLGNQ